MAGDEPILHSFIIRIWVDAEGEARGPGNWHGQITHVPGAERRSLRELNDIVAFIQPYLHDLSVGFGFRWQLRQCLKRWSNR